MNINRSLLCSCSLLLLVSANVYEATAQQPQRRTTSAPKTAQTSATTGDAAKAELEAAAKLEPRERVERLEKFLKERANSSLRTQAVEMLVSARAAYADDLLRTGDTANGIKQFEQAIADAPPDMTENLFVKVVAQIPSNLSLRGQLEAALKAAQAVEAKAGDNAKRLLTIAAFYLSVERASDAARVASQAIKLAPDMAAAHQALGMASRVGLRLDRAEAAYARAVELDPASATAQRSLADMKRANGKAAEAVTIYRARVQADNADVNARAGLVLSLFDSGARAEAERELEAALKENETNLPLLVGAAYFYATQKDAAKALLYAERAVKIEPRYTWAQIAYGRALMLSKRPFEAERVLRYATQYGSFPTLQYELATALAANGLYDEATEELSKAFALKENGIQARLANQVTASAENFLELLAPERQAGIFQAATADTEANAAQLKNLLRFNQSLRQIDSVEGTVRLKEAAALKASDAARAFANGGDDEMRIFRQLYAANRLLRRKAGFDAIIEMMEAAKSNVTPALDSPTATTAALADEVSNLSSRQAVSGGGQNVMPALPRQSLEHNLRGRIEDTIGWALFNQEKAAEAIAPLKRAVSVLPPASVWWRDAMFHLGASLEADGKQQEALNAYIESYKAATTPDPARRSIIEALYRKLNNNTLDGLDRRLDPQAATSNTSTP